MLEPGSIAGRSISPSAVLGPEFRRRRSLDIFIRLVAIVFKPPLASTHASLLCIASLVFLSRASASKRRLGRSLRTISSAEETWIADGKTSFVDWHMFTWSFG